MDFSTQDSWQKTMDRHPSIIHFGSRYYKELRSTIKLDLLPEQLKYLKFWLNMIERDEAVTIH